VLPFPSRHWHLLSWSARAARGADDLAVANPALAFVLASAGEFERGADRPTQLPIWAHFPCLPQRQLQARLGFPPTEQTRHILQKIVHSALDIARLHGLRAVRRPPRRPPAATELPLLDLAED
jgi:hypothetical protein